MVVATGSPKRGYRIFDLTPISKADSDSRKNSTTTSSTYPGFWKKSFPTPAPTPTTKVKKISLISCPTPTLEPIDSDPQHQLKFHNVSDYNSDTQSVKNYHYICFRLPTPTPALEPIRLLLCTTMTPKLEKNTTPTLSQKTYLDVIYSHDMCLKHTLNVQTQHAYRKLLNIYLKLKFDFLTVAYK